MPKTMLIDAYHREETRVAVTQGGRVEDFDFEYASRKPLRGNIYLARVTRVEPSLQAAFIEYGGNRHGFLAFGEIHPDYYQIPVADREVLRKAEALEVELAKKLAERDHDSDDDVDPDDDDELRGRTDDQPDADAEGSLDDSDDDTAQDDPQGLIDSLGEAPASAEAAASSTKDPDDQAEAAADASDAVTEDDDSQPVWTSDDDDDDPKGTIGLEHDERETRVSDESDVEHDTPEPSGDDAGSDEVASEAAAEIADEPADEPAADGTPSVEVTVDASDTADADADTAEETGDAAPGEADNEAEPVDEELAALRAEYEQAKRDRNRLLRAYKIQEVIKRRQIMLVQVVKEERGNKGAAVTTYLSLAGRYGVLMPNTARGGGISRKITSQGDRKRLKKSMAELDIAPNMGLIIRTAGAKRTKTEIKRDYDYLLRLWETIRERTLESVAPCLIYEEASLIKRAIRDLYDKDTGEIQVQGEEGYREAKDFMKMLMPSHAKNVQRYKAAVPIFLKHKVEHQLDQMYQPVVQLKSGGYLVIQQTEALVSIDVNSGKATKERNVEATALKTNSEAAVEVARQCRLRDLAGLIVIDFIDMEENRNNRTVEKKFKEAMKNDRARTQIGNISGFGLMEMSRQRRRSGIVDGTTQTCPVCDGAGVVRSHEMAAVRVLRAAEGVAAQGKNGLITVKASTDVALYVLNTKRAWLERMETTYGIKTNILADSSKFGDQYEVDGSGTPSETATLRDVVGDDAPLSELEAPELPGEDTASDETSDDENAGEDKPKRRRRRRRRRGGEGRSDDAEDNRDTTAEDETASEDSDEDAEVSSEAADDADDGDGEPRRKRRRGRRGGRRNRRSRDERDGTDTLDADAGQEAVSEETVEPEDAADDGSDETLAAAEVETEAPADGEPVTDAEPLVAAVEEPQTPDPSAAEVDDETEDEEPAVLATATAAFENAPEPVSKEPRRVGWWQRAFQKP
ncbi:MAG: Rne/Rng family ribonuclease [Pseudomonadota bacterium]